MWELNENWHFFFAWAMICSQFLIIYNWHEWGLACIYIWTMRCLAPRNKNIQPCIELWILRCAIAHQADDVIITSLLCQNGVTASFWNNNNVIITSCVRWEGVIAVRRRFRQSKQIYRLLSQWCLSRIDLLNNVMQHTCCEIWFLWRCCHRLVSMVAVNGLVAIWCPDISHSHNSLLGQIGVHQRSITFFDEAWQTLWQLSVHFWWLNNPQSI